MKVKRKKIVRLGYVVFGIIIVAVIVNQIEAAINSPTSGSVSYPKASSSQTTLASPNLKPNATPILTTYASFNYPALFSKDTTNKAVSPVLADYNYKYISDPSWYISISIYNYPGGNIQTNSDYNFRKLYPSRYPEQIVQVNNHIVYIFSDNTSPGYNKLAFLVSQNYQATVDVNSLGNSQQYLDQTFQMLIDTWNWKD